MTDPKSLFMSSLKSSRLESYIETIFEGPLANIAIKIRESPIIKTHWTGLVRQHKTFEGKKLVDFVIAEKYVKDRPSGIRLGRALLEADFLHHIDYCEHFKDSKELYRLKFDDLDIVPGPSAPLVTGCCINHGWVKKKRSNPTRWRERFMVLMDTELLWFKAELSPSPKGRTPVAKLKVDIENCSSCKKDWYGFHLIDDGRKLHVICDNPREHVNWLIFLYKIKVPFSEGARKKLFLKMFSNYVNAQFGFDVKTIQENTSDSPLPLRRHPTINFAIETLLEFQQKFQALAESDLNSNARHLDVDWQKTGTVYSQQANPKNGIAIPINKNNNLANHSHFTNNNSHHHHHTNNNNHRLSNKILHGDHLNNNYNNSDLIHHNRTKDAPATSPLKISFEQRHSIIVKNSANKNDVDPRNRISKDHPVFGSAPTYPPPPISDNSSWDSETGSPLNTIRTAPAPIVPAPSKSKTLTRSCSWAASPSPIPRHLSPHALDDSFGEVRMRRAKSYSAQTPWKISPSELVVGDLIGEGAFGKVFKALWRNSVVAVKQSHYDPTSPEAEVFIEEVALWKRLRPHQNVVGFFGALIEKGHPLSVVIEYCPLGSLHSLLVEDPEALDQNQKLGVLQDVAIGMAHIHTEKIIHRDIAARNILLATSNDVLIAKVTDFGLSRFSEHQSIPSTGATGPIRWMAPEALTEKVASMKTDVWSFGVVCWEILNEGAKPYGEFDNLKAALAVMNGYRLQLPPVETQPLLHHMMSKCFETEPEDRPSFNEIIQLFQEGNSINNIHNSMDF